MNYKYPMETMFYFRNKNSRRVCSISLDVKRDVLFTKLEIRNGRKSSSLGAAVRTLWVSLLLAFSDNPESLLHCRAVLCRRVCPPSELLELRSATQWCSNDYPPQQGHSDVLMITLLSRDIAFSYINKRKTNVKAVVKQIKQSTSGWLAASLTE